MDQVLSDYQWYPIYTHPRAEKKTAELLKKNGIHTFLPLQKTLKQWSDRKKWVEEPIFKSYLFVFIKQIEKELVLKTYGVVRFIYFNGVPAIIAHKDMELFMAYLSENAQPEIITDFLKKGKKVKILYGKLKGYDAEIVSIHHQNRLILRLDAIGQSLLLNINPSDVGPINL